MDNNHPLKRKPSRLELQRRAGVVELGQVYDRIENYMALGLEFSQERPSIVICSNAADLMRAMGINPIPDKVVSQESLYQHGDAIQVECYNKGWYFFYKGGENMILNLAMDGTLYCQNAIIAPHDNFPGEGRAKVHMYLDFLKNYDLL